MRIVQITDSHVTAAGTLWKDQLDNGARLGRAVAAVNRIGADLVVHTGDVVEDGATADGPAQYGAAADMLAALDAPLRLLPGNHDGRAAMRAAFPDQDWHDAPFLQFSDHAEGLRLIGLDTVEEGRVGGRVCADRLHWLSQRLDDGPTLIFLHHPPGDMGLRFMDGFGFDGGDALAGALTGANVLRLACGHVHAEAEVHWGGTTVSAASAVSAQISPDTPALSTFTPETKLEMTVEPIRLRVFDWMDGVLSVKTVMGEDVGQVLWV